MRFPLVRVAPIIISGKGDPAEEDDRRAAPEVRSGAAGGDAAVRAAHDHLLQPAAPPAQVQRTGTARTCTGCSASGQGRYSVLL